MIRGRGAPCLVFRRLRCLGDGATNGLSIDAELSGNGGNGQALSMKSLASSDARLREGLLDKTNTASGVWADTAYRSKANEEVMEKNGFVSRVRIVRISVYDQLNIFMPWPL